MKNLFYVAGFAIALIAPGIAQAEFSTTRVLLTTTMKSLLNDGWAIHSISGPPKRNIFILERSGKWVYCESIPKTGRNGKPTVTRFGYSYADRCFTLN